MVFEVYGKTMGSCIDHDVFLCVSGGGATSATRPEVAFGTTSTVGGATQGLDARALPDGRHHESLGKSPAADSKGSVIWGQQGEERYCFWGW